LSREASAKRIAANRENAKRSTGPKTPEGKAVVRLNGMKHGIYSEMTVVDFEEERELVAFGRRMRAELAPVGELELALADRIVSLAWRIRRLTSVEGEILEAGNNDRQPGCAFGGYSGEKLQRLSRYETTLDRQFYRTLHELQRLQAARRGERVPVPEAVDVTVSVAADHAGNSGSGWSSGFAPAKQWRGNQTRERARSPRRTPVTAGFLRDRPRSGRLNFA
jgi:hypothetical protein